MRFTITSLPYIVAAGLMLSPLAARGEPPQVRITGPSVVVSSHSDGCDDLDIPDISLRAFRADSNKVVAFASHYRGRRLVGPDLLSLTKDCSISYEGKHWADPALFDDRTWIAAIWREDNGLVYAIGHNEYQADKFPGRCQFKTYPQCWYNSLVPLVSSDGGKTFARDGVEPIVAPPFKSEENQGIPRGYFNPSNIISFGGHHYMLVSQSGIEGEQPGICLFRNEHVSEPLKWTFWDGEKFVPAGGSPYSGRPMHGACKPLKGARGAIGSVAQLADGTFALFTIVEDANSPEGGAVEVSYSSDLIEWKSETKILRLTPAWVKKCQDGFRYSYVSVIDERDQTVNFEHIGRSASMFLIRMNCDHPLERDIVRYPLSIKAE